MRALIGFSLLASNFAQPRRRPFEICDTRLAGFTLRIQPSGVRSYYARFGRNGRTALGKVGSINPDEARKKCQRILGNIASGRHPQEGLADAAGMTLGRFLTETYEPWARVNRPRTARNTLEKVRLVFKSWMAEPLSAITVARLDEKPLYSVALGLPGRDPRTQVMPLERPFLVNGLAHNSKPSVLDLRL